MHYRTLPVSTHALVALRPLQETDIPAWFEYLTQPEVFTHTSWNLGSPDELMPYVTEPVSRASRLRLAIARRSDDRLVGTAGFHTVMPDQRTAEIAYDLAPAVWGQGIASEMCRLLTQWAHAEVGLVRVQATVLESNVRSARVLERCGFEREGLLRSYRQVRGRSGNFLMYAHVAAEEGAP